MSNNTDRPRGGLASKIRFAQGAVHPLEKPEDKAAREFTEFERRLSRLEEIANGPRKNSAR